MKTFYLLRSEDIHGKSGTGVVAEGVIFDDGTGAFTWLTPIKTVTTFWKIGEVKKLHGHEGRTEVIIEGKDRRFQACKKEVRIQKLRARQKGEVKDEN